MATVEFKIKNIKAADGTAATLAEVQGSIDATSIGQFTNVMDKLVEKGVQNLVLDCSNVKYINSTGLGTLLKYVDTFESRGGHMAFIKVPSKVMLVMEMLGFNALFNILEDETAALEAFAGDAPAEPEPEPAPAMATPAPAVPSPAPAPPPPPAPVAPGVSSAPSVSFPIRVDCTRCTVTLETNNPGKYRCPRCGTILSVEAGGRVRFFASKKIKPVQLVMPTDLSIVAGVGPMVNTVARQVGFNGEFVDELSDVITDTCVQAVTAAYGQDNSRIFHVIIIPEQGQLTVRISDHGQALQFEGGSPQTDSRFARAAQTMDAIEHAAGPRGGNLITLTKRLA